MGQKEQLPEGSRLALCVLGVFCIPVVFISAAMVIALLDMLPEAFFKWVDSYFFPSSLLLLYSFLGVALALCWQLIICPKWKSGDIGWKVFLGMVIWAFAAGAMFFGIIFCTAPLNFG